MYVCLQRRLNKLEHEADVEIVWIEFYNVSYYVCEKNIINFTTTVTKKFRCFGENNITWAYKFVV